MNMRIIYVVCLLLIECNSSILNRDRRQLKLDYETTTVPFTNTREKIDVIEESITVGNFEVHDYLQNPEQLNDTDSNSEDSHIESIIPNFIANNDSFDTAELNISKLLNTSFMSQREAVRRIMKHSESLKSIQLKSTLFDDWSDQDAKLNLEKVNIQKTRKKRDLLDSNENSKDTYYRNDRYNVESFPYGPISVQNVPIQYSLAVDASTKLNESQDFDNAHVKMFNKSAMLVDISKMSQDKQDMKLQVDKNNEKIEGPIDFFKNYEKSEQPTEIINDRFSIKPTERIAVLSMDEMPNTSLRKNNSEEQPFITTSPRNKNIKRSMTKRDTQTLKPHTLEELETLSPEYFGGDDSNDDDDDFEGPKNLESTFKRQSSGGRKINEESPMRVSLDTSSTSPANDNIEHPVLIVRIASTLINFWSFLRTAVSEAFSGLLRIK